MFIITILFLAIIFSSSILLQKEILDLVDLFYNKVMSNKKSKYKNVIQEYILPPIKKDRILDLYEELDRIKRENLTR